MSGGGGLTAMTIRIEIKNLDEVTRLFQELGPRAAAVLPQAVEAGAEVLRERMAALGPGDGIAVEMEGSTALVGPDAAHFYYAFFETGTGAHLVEPRAKEALHWGDTFAARAVAGGMAARPFMRPAVDGGKEQVAEAVGGVLKAAIE